MTDRHSRRWFQLSVKSLFLLTLLVAAFLLSWHDMIHYWFVVSGVLAARVSLLLRHSVGKGQVASGMLTG